MPETLASASGLHQTAYTAAALLLRHDSEVQQHLLEYDTIDTFVEQLIAVLTRGT
jgi:hypothetical protein